MPYHEHMSQMVVPGQYFNILRGKKSGYKAECGGGTSTQLVICRSAMISDTKHLVTIAYESVHKTQQAVLYYCI